jgi:sec-independent protein translocase protein TatB
VFNLQGSEIIFILLIALVILGPEKLPGAIRRAMKTYAELRKLGDGFQSEFKSVIDEPLREMKETAGLIKDQVDPKKFAESAEREAESKAAAAKERTREEAIARMHVDGAAASVDDAVSSNPSVDEFADPVEVTPEAQVEPEVGPANEDIEPEAADAELADSEAEPAGEEASA